MTADFGPYFAHQLSVGSLERLEASEELPRSESEDVEHRGDLVENDEATHVVPPLPISGDLVQQHWGDHPTYRGALRQHENPSGQGRYVRKES